MSLNPRIHKTHIQEGLNSWYLRTGNIHNFICKCGRIEQYYRGVVSTEHHPSHQCSQCGNSYYIDCEMFLHNEKVKIWKEIHWQPVYYAYDTEWHIEYIINIPVFDTKVQKIVITRFEVFYTSMSLSGGGSTETLEYEMLEREVYNGLNKPRRMTELIAKEAKRHLHRFIEEKPHEKITWLLDEPDYIALPSIEKKLDALSFFLEYDGLKHFEYYHWHKLRRFRYAELDIDDFTSEHMNKVFTGNSVEEVLGKVCNKRHEKSVKRACFRAYTDAMKHQYYDPMPDIFFSRYVSDPNLLVRLIRIDPGIKHQIFRKVSFNNTAVFFNLLKGYYDELSLVRIFESISSDAAHKDIVQDICWMLIVNEDMIYLIREHFRKPPANIDALHNELIRVKHIGEQSVDMNEEFDYLPHELKAQVTVENFSFILPKTAAILDKWSRILHNCMFSYRSRIKKHQTLIYGVILDGELKYAVEVYNQIIVQTSGKFNKKIGKEDMSVVDQWFRSYVL